MFRNVDAVRSLNSGIPPDTHGAIMLNVEMQMEGHGNLSDAGSICRSAACKNRLFSDRIDVSVQV
jgi:hypothetical protein